MRNGRITNIALIQFLVENGTVSHLRDGLLHRDDGPAIIHADGTKEWCLNGATHREDGPAIIYPNGMLLYYLDGINVLPEIVRELMRRKAKEAYRWTKSCYLKDGLPHRIDGPAIIWQDGSVEFWLNGTQLSQAEFEEWRRPQ